MKQLLILCACALTAVGAISAISACEQGRGDRCQVHEDCAKGLTCNVATNTCQSREGTMPLDTLPIPDAPVDAPPDTP